MDFTASSRADSPAVITPVQNAHGNRRLNTGTTDDTADMHRLGKTQERKSNFRSFSVLGPSSVIMAMWVAILGSASFSLIIGGLAGTVWVFIGVWVFTVPVTASLAEKASIYIISIGCVLYQCIRGPPLPKSLPVNAEAYYSIPTTTISFFPLFAQVSIQLMNWGVVTFAGVAVISMIYYIVHGRKVCTGPVVHGNYG